VTSKLIGKNHPVYKVSIVPDAVDHFHKFALIVSSSHIIGDNYTYYKLFHMLSTQAPLEPLIATRIDDYKQRVEKLMGTEEAFYFEKSNPNMVDQMLDSYNKEERGKETLLFTISQEWLDYQMKQSVMDAERDRAEKGGDEGEESSSSPLPSLRPAEVILSWWFKLSDADIGMYPHQLRNHLDVLSERHAGNYNNPIPYTKADYATPYLIRESLQTCRRCGRIPIKATTTVNGDVTSSLTPLPKIGTGKSFALGVDWNDAYPKPLQLCTETDDIEEDLHLPLFTASDLLALPSKISMCLLFTAKTGTNDSSSGGGGEGDDDSRPEQRIGAFIVAKKDICDRVMASGIIDEDMKSTLTKDIVNKRGSMIQFDGLPDLQDALGLDADLDGDGEHNEDIGGVAGEETPADEECAPVSERQSE
jgi:hypothetical protein